MQKAADARRARVCALESSSSSSYDLQHHINLTSDAVNGFVLFAQVADSIDINAQGSIEFTTTSMDIISI